MHLVQSSVCCMTDAGVLPSVQLLDQRAPRGPAEQSTSAGAAQAPPAAPRAANGRAPSRGRRGPGRGQQRPTADSAAAAAERALTDLRLQSADAASSQAHARPSGRPPRPESRLQASAAPFVPDASDPSEQPHGQGDLGRRPRPRPREGRRHQSSDASPVGGALSDAQASAARALGVAAQQQQRRRRQRPSRGGGSGSGAGAETEPRHEGASAPVDGTEEAAQTSDDGGDDHSCPICTDPLMVRPRKLHFTSCCSVRTPGPWYRSRLAKARHSRAHASLRSCRRWRSGRATMSSVDGVHCASGCATATTAVRSATWS